MTSVKIALAETEARAADPDSSRAIAILDEALTTCEGSAACAPVRSGTAEGAEGDILLKRDPVNPLPAEEALRFAIVGGKAAGDPQL